MAKLELSRDLSLSPEEAWEHASNLSGLGDWLQMHEGWRGEVPSELTVGTTLVGVAGAKGMRNRVTWTVRELDPPPAPRNHRRRCGWHQVRAQDVGGADELGCSFSVTIDLGGRPLFGPIGMAAARAVKGDIERSIRKFESLYC